MLRRTRVVFFVYNNPGVLGAFSGGTLGVAMTFTPAYFECNDGGNTLSDLDEDVRGSLWG